LKDNNITYPLLVNELKVRLVDEGIFRLRLCINELSLEAINKQLNANTLSIGQSIVHLNGNVRQWLFEHLLGQKNSRHRSKELEYCCESKNELLEMMIDLESDLLISLEPLRGLNPEKEHTIQGIPNTVVSTIVHVIEHFSYHTGQVALLSKIALNRDLGFYKDYKALE
jgi:uncharacterized damage-inducible protein DinB